MEGKSFEDTRRRNVKHDKKLKARQVGVQCVFYIFASSTSGEYFLLSFFRLFFILSQTVLFKEEEELPWSQLNPCAKIPRQIKSLPYRNIFQGWDRISGAINLMSKINPI